MIQYSPMPRLVTAVLIGRLGDLIVATPMLRALKAKYPDARLRLVVSKLGREAAAMIPAVDEVVVLGAKALPRLLASKSDLAVDLNPSFSKTSAALMLALRAPVKLGFSKRKWNEVYTEVLSAPKDDEPMLARYARMAAALKAPYEPRMELSLSDAHRAGARDALARLPPKKGARVLIHPGNFKKFDNRWPEDCFVALADKLQDAGVDVVFMAGPGELEPVKAIVSRLKKVCPVLPPASLGVTGAVMKSADLVVLNVTGTTHLAAALDVPTFCFYAGYTNAVWHPPGPLHRGIVSRSWTSCRDLSVEDAWAALTPLLKNSTK
jgi:ADP-heptose:LPS heptosyltransferase